MPGKEETFSLSFVPFYFTRDGNDEKKKLVVRFVLSTKTILYLYDEKRLSRPIKLNEERLKELPHENSNHFTREVVGQLLRRQKIVTNYFHSMGKIPNLSRGFHTL